MLRWGRLKAAEERGKWGCAERRKGREHKGGKGSKPALGARAEPSLLLLLLLILLLLLLLS